MQKSKKRKVEDNAMEVGEPSNATHTNGNAETSIHEEIDHISDDEEGGVRIGDIYIPPAPKPTCSFDSKGPRLIITHIVNENFKSYAGVEVLGPFHKSFTAIIGPNGSGKSNVIDSMLFVFGYRASKIRSKKISVLIHSSSKYPNLTSTTVAVHFCRIIDGEGEAFEVVPNSEIVVSRTAFRDSSSFYTLNGKRVQFKEVSRMLRSHGIDLDYNRFLILQEPIEKLAVKVEEYSDLRKEKLNRVRLVEQEKQALMQPMQEAVDLLNMTNTYTRSRNMVLQKYIYETKKIMETKQQSLDECKANLAEIDEKLKKIQEELQEKTGVLKEGTKKYDVLRKKKEEVTEKLQSCKRSTVTTQADLTQSNKKKKNLDQLIEQEKGKLIDLELIPEKNQREIDDCGKLLEKHTEQKAKAEEELQAVVASVRSRTQSLQETKDKLQGKLMELKKIVDEANNCYKLAESELKIYLSTEKKENEKLENMQAAYEKASSALEQKKPLQEELSQSLPQQEKQLNEMNHKIQKLKKEEATLIAEVRPLRAQIEESRQAMSANTSRNKVLNALMNEKRNGRLPGIFGRLGDLGGIDSKYDVAISTCCGGLDNIVVDTVETAQAAVEFLKRNDVGRATFIALDKQEHLKQVYAARHTYPENVPRLFDLVKVKDERVLPAFYYALRDTLVANDLEQATRIAYGRTRYRTVSLKGDVIELAGTMTGGGKQTTRGKMSSSVQQDTSEADPRVIKANEDKLAKMEQRLVEVRNEVSELEEALSILQLTVRDNRTALNKLNIELKNLVEQVPVIQSQIKQHEKKVAASRVDPQQKASLEATVASALKKLEKAKENASEVESDVHEIDEQISAVAGGKVRDLQKAVDDLTKKIDKVNSEMTKLKVSINTSKRNAKKSKDKINQMETDLRDTEKNIETLNNTKKQLTLDSAKYEKELEELDEQINEGTDEFKELKQEINKLQSTENKIKGERMERKNDLRTLKLEDPQIEGIAELEPVTPLVQHTDEELSEINVEELRNRLTAQKNRIGDKKPNIQAIQDYKAKEELYIRRAAELDEITNRRNEMRALHDELRKKRMTDFLAGFNTITGKLKEMYQMITLGGDAELELVDSLDPFTEGIIFSVRPPNKSWKNISNLSGGEKTLSSLALVFALHYYKPTPLYVMDEIDAALDFKNVSIVANYIKDRTKNAQFIIISLRYNMFEASNRLVGIYKTEDCTHCVAINNEDFDQHLGSLVEGQKINA
ncbi:hypothetical protein HW555_001046 [Spodoptera exigua]|uniref:Structural maintenance of chromosomes protein n=1 Tax=Spodoptera exigua TaxID=7107 RepID=A0A835GRE7_SPOEX|nr:hypothetical protein HW555_001046 [Spodoptera exigua]